MNPGAVLFSVMYDMWVAMLKLLECGCLSIIGLQRDDDGDEDDEKTTVRSVPDGSDNKRIFFGFTRDAHNCEMQTFCRDVG